MNLGDVQSRTITPTLDGIGAAASRAPGTGALGAISGNSLMGLDAWAGVSASGRAFDTAGISPGNSTLDIEQAVNHILAPLG